jgi:hypothetical protein
MTNVRTLLYIIMTCLISYCIFSFLFWDWKWVADKSLIFWRFVYFLIVVFLYWLEFSQTEVKDKKAVDEKKSIDYPM